MKKIITTTLMLLMYLLGNAQISLNSGGLLKPMEPNDTTPQSSFFKGMNMYVYEEPKKDTLKCMFLEVLNVDSAKMKWTTGYVEAEDRGYITFGYKDNEELTKVSKSYLPITSGVVRSNLYYLNGNKVKNLAIKVIILPLDIKTLIIH